jgi:hypothetical protein
MTRIEKVQYTAKAHTTGGRDGASRSSDGRLGARLSEGDMSVKNSTIELRASRIDALRIDSWRAVLVRPVKRLLAWIRSESQIRRDIDALIASDDRSLADIGLRRGEIGYGVRYGRLPDHRYDRLR